jgi:glutathione peroxidase
MRHLTTALLLLVLSVPVAMSQAPAGEAVENAACASWLNHRIGQLHTDQVIDLCRETAGKPLLLVNTASYCGFTYQFAGLEALYQRYKDRGLVIIGFPSDDFFQEDDDAAKTAEICYVNYGVSFLMTEAIEVRGSDAHPVFQHLAREQAQPNWNFNKYVVDREGNVTELFRSITEPDDARLLAAIELIL